MNKEQEILEAIDERGEIGIIDAAAKPLDTNLLAVRLGNGDIVCVETNDLTAISDGKFSFAKNFQNAQRLRASSSNNDNQNISQQSGSNLQNSAMIGARANERDQIVVPLIAEEISINRKTVETGGVRVHKTVREDVQTIDEPIIREHLNIERLEINQFVETAPAVRYEGDIMIVPVLEEVIVTQKRLLLREEIRLTKRREEISNPQTVTLRREEIKLEKIGTDNIEPGTSER